MDYYDLYEQAAALHDRLVIVWAQRGNTLAASSPDTLAELGALNLAVTGAHVAVQALESLIWESSVTLQETLR